MGNFVALVAIVLAVVGFGTAAHAWTRSQRLRRAEYIRTFRFPRGLFKKFGEHYPDMGRKDIALVSRGLRQFFIAYLMSGNKYVAMPSKAVDDLWHEFILYTREYKAFCNKAFGEFLHHTPAAALEPQRRRSNEGLRRVWWFACKYEYINATNPTRLPLLFALDAKLGVPDGYHYEPDCEQLRRQGVPGTQCANDFTRTDIDGTTAGFGERKRQGSAGCGGGGAACGGGEGSSCGGGCGGCGGG